MKTESRSINKMEAELIPKICEFCEASREIEMKCVNCNLFLCGACHLKIHSKIKAANDHNGINVQDYCTESIFENSRKVNLKQMSCIKHNQKTCFMFCKDCEQLICSTCIIESHDQHKFEEIDNAYHEKVNKLENETIRIDSEIPKVEIKATRLREMKFEGEKSFLEIKSKIFQHEYQIKEDISMEAKTLLARVDARWKVTKDSITKQGKQVQKIRDDLKKRNAQLSLILNSRQADEFFSKASNINHLSPITFLSHVQIETFRFTPSNRDCKEIGLCHKKERFEFFHAFQTNLAISKMLKIEENQYVLYSHIENKLQQVQFIDKTINIQKEVNNVVASDIASNLYCLTDNGKLMRLPLCTNCQYSDDLICIHVNNENQIVVGSKFDDNPYEEIYSGMIMIFTSVVYFHDYTYKEIEDPLFRRVLDNFIPDRITSTRDNDYCLIVRETLHGRKQIARFNHKFEFKWAYDGCCKDNFFPADVTEAPSELIYVADAYNGTIHVLNQDGDVVTCNLLANENVADPLSVYITVPGMIFIGCKKTKKNQPAHIYLFKLK
ncbi:unnamed protein product [Mytilus coruscus]|uniref:B box-type domain-containing protein n=1 Tax=Mytilus coruscus TaxID=42192 RepID=A0A6J8B4V5_MYTCO|nr:unnamed protein product [Mytilus coruscus]